MIQTHNCCPDAHATWQHGFLEILPEIQDRLGHAFRRLDPESRDDATEDGIVHCLLSYIRLFEQGRLQSVSPSNLAWYAMLQVRRGRQAACRLNTREPLSRYAQLGKGIKIEPLQSYIAAHGDWVDQIVTDRRSSVGDQVAARMDIRAWLATLSRRTRKIAEALAYGFSTAEVARKNRLSASRISQLRKTLARSWAEFQKEDFCTAPQ